MNASKYLSVPRQKLKLGYGHIRQLKLFTWGSDVGFGLSPW